MKKITLFCFLLIASMSTAQQVLIEDFESTDPAANVSGFEGLKEASIGEAPSGSNGKSFKIITSATGQGWQGAQLVLQTGTLFNFTNDKTVKVDIYSDKALNIMAKVEDKVGDPADAASANPQNHTGSGWETLTFSLTTSSDGSAVANGTYSQIAFFPLRNAGDSGWDTPSEFTIYVDNIFAEKTQGAAATCTDGIQNGDETGVDCGGSCAPCAADPEPASGPTTPTARNAWDVISIYGDSYGTAAGFNGVNWDNGADATEGSYGGNNALKISNGTGDFIGFDIANTDGYVNGTDMTHIHADFWIAGSYVAGQVVKIKLSNHDDNAEINAIIKEVVPGAGDAETWISIDADMGAEARDKIKQILLIYTNSGGAPSIIYADNIYMYRAATASIDNNQLLGFSMYPNPATNRLNISAKETIQNADIFNVLGKKVMSVNINKTSESIDVSNLSSGIYLVKYNVSGTAGTAKFIKQ